MLQVDKMKTSELKGLFSVETYCSAVFFSFDINYGIEIF